MNNSPVYSWVARTLHWLTALLIFWAIVLGLVADALPASPEQVLLFVLHKSAGITVLALVLVRLGWRVLNAPPPLDLPPAQAKLAHMGHWGLYALMIVLPLTGWLLNSAAGYPFAWFNLVSVPFFPGVGEAQKPLFEQLHEVMFYVIAVAIAGHVVMLVVHKLSQDHNLLPRMLPRTSSAGVLLLICVGLLGFTLYTANQARVNEQLAQVNEPAQAQTLTSDRAQVSSPHWVLVPKDEQLTFTGYYSGEPFKGAIQSFVPNLYFDPSRVNQGVIDVDIDTASITTFNSDWDSSLKGSQWFATKKYPQAKYISESIRTEGDGFVADGQLQLKGVVKPLTVRFQWQSQDDSAQFIGTALIDRRAFNIGSGSWAEDDSIGFEVVLDIQLELTLAR